MRSDLLTIKGALDKSARYLKDKGVESSRLDAEVLLSTILGLRRIDLYLKFDRPLNEKEKGRYREFLKRRAQFEPVAYITGEKEFMSLPFYVNPSVLIPRPDTEILAETSMKKIRSRIAAHPEKSPEIFEIGAGSGALAVSILVNIPDIEITASDISTKALETAQRNAERHGVRDRLYLLEGDLFAGSTGPYDFIISNPPYIPEQQKKTLQKDILDHEPHAALFAGEHGLDVIDRVITEGRKFLLPDSWILVEIGDEQYQKIIRKHEIENNFSKVEAVEDYTGTVRVLCLQK